MAALNEALECMVRFGVQRIAQNFYLQILMRSALCFLGTFLQCYLHAYCLVPWEAFSIVLQMLTALGFTCNLLYFSCFKHPSSEAFHCSLLSW